MLQENFKIYRINSNSEFIIEERAQPHGHALLIRLTSYVTRLFFLIAETANRKTAVLTAVVPTHVGVVVVQVAAVGAAAAGLGSTPEVGVDARTAEMAPVPASGNGTKARSVVGFRGLVAGITLTAVTAPVIRGRGQRLCNGRGVCWLATVQIIIALLGIAHILL